MGSTWHNTELKYNSHSSSWFVKALQIWISPFPVWTDINIPSSLCFQHCNHPSQRYTATLCVSTVFFFHVLYYSSHYLDYIAANSRMADEWWTGMDLRGCRYDPGICLEELRKTIKKPWGGTAGVLAKIWVEYLLNMNLKCYHYVNWLVSIVLSVDCCIWSICHFCEMHCNTMVPSSP
jgi:hypothetical protein